MAGRVWSDSFLSKESAFLAQAMPGRLWIDSCLLKELLHVCGHCEHGGLRLSLRRPLGRAQGCSLPARHLGACLGRAGEAREQCSGAPQHAGDSGCGADCSTDCGTYSVIDCSADGGTCSGTDCSTACDTDSGTGCSPGCGTDGGTGCNADYGT